MNILKRFATTTAAAAVFAGLSLSATQTAEAAAPVAATAATPAVAANSTVTARLAARKYTKPCSKYKKRKVRRACVKAKRRAAASAPASAPAPKPFAAPTTITYTGATCRRDGDVWYVTAHWRVTGGRYANLGNPNDEPTLNDNVYNGEARRIDSDMEFRNWPGAVADGETTSVEFYFQQMIAPIGRADDVTSWRLTERWIRINLTCV